MGTPIAFTSGSTNTFHLGTTKRATIALNPATSLTSGFNWFNGVDVSATQYLIYSDTFSQGQATIANARPTAWTTPDLGDASLLALINTLPDRVGLNGFTDINVALQWLEDSEKYFLIKGGYNNIVTNGLVLNLDAGWADSYLGSGTVWTDLSPETNNGTLVNGVGFSTDGQGSLSFDDVDDYVSMGSSSIFNITNEISVFAWVNFSNNSVWNGVFGSDGGGFVHFQTINGGPNVFVYGPNAGYDNLDGFTIPINTWTHFGFTFSSNTLRIYVNTVQLPTTVIGSGANVSSNSDIRIGRVFSDDRFLGGKIASVQVYNKGLTPTEILQNYNATKSRFSFGGQSLFAGVTQYLDFSKSNSYPGSGTFVTDITGNGNDATFNNGSFTTFNGVKCFNATSASSWLVSDPVTLGSNYTIFIWANMLAKSQVVSWRTLVRSSLTPPGEDHELIVEYSSNLLGYYDNENGTGFNSYGINVANAGLENNWILYTLVGENATSQKVYINDGTTNASLNRNASGQQIIGIGNYQGGSQQFGYVANYILYNNQVFTQSQVSQYFDATKQYYGYASNDIPNYGLVMNLDAGNPISYPGSGTVWYDSSGNGINGALENGPTYSTNGGGSIVLDGVDDRISVAHNNNLNFGTGDFTVLVWVSGVTSYPGGNTAIIMKGSRFDANLAGWGIMWAGSPEDLYFIIASDSGRLEGRTIPNGGLNGWTGWKLIGMQRRSGTWYQIVDTTFTSLGTFTGNVDNTQTLYMGYNSVYGGYLSSSYGNALIYNRALNQSELIQLYNAQKTRFGL
jgi:hypothetical protein